MIWPIGSKTWATLPVVADEGIAILGAADGVAAEDRSAVGLVIDEVRRAVQSLIVDAVYAVDVAAQLREGREHLTDAVDHLPPPIAFDDQAVGIGAVLVGEHHDVGIEAKLAADDRVLEDVVVIDDRVDRRFGEGFVGEQAGSGCCRSACAQ